MNSFASDKHLFSTERSNKIIFPHDLYTFATFKLYHNFGGAKLIFSWKQNDSVDICFENVHTIIQRPQWKLRLIKSNLNLTNKVLEFNGFKTTKKIWCKIKRKHLIFSKCVTLTIWTDGKMFLKHKMDYSQIMLDITIIRFYTNMWSLCSSTKPNTHMRMHPPYTHTCKLAPFLRHTLINTGDHVLTEGLVKHFCLIILPFKALNQCWTSVKWLSP